jgi:hypothetical protein
MLLLTWLPDPGVGSIHGLLSINRGAVMIANLGSEMQQRQVDASKLLRLATG